MNTTALKMIPTEHSRLRRASRLEVRIAQCQKAKDQIFRFRYHHYVQALGRDKARADHQSKMLMDDLDQTAQLIGVYKENRLVGTGRVNLSAECQFPEEDLYHFSEYEREYPGRLSLVSKVVVDPEVSGSRVFLEIARACMEITCKNHCPRAFIATSDKLVSLFRKLGFVPYRPRVESYLDYGSSNPMILATNDFAHMRSVNSPLLDIAIKHFAGPLQLVSSSPEDCAKRFAALQS